MLQFSDFREGLPVAHQADVAMHYGTCTVTGLDCDGSRDNWDILNVKTMEWEGARRG